MKLQNKYQQLVVGLSGAPKFEDVTNVHLKKDGKVTGFVKGYRVVTDQSMKIWNYMLGDK